MRSGVAFAGVATLGLLVTTSFSALGAQHPIEGTEWPMLTIRPSGQPVAPVFEGWYQNDDGTYSLVFGYHSLNSAEVVEVPLGPDNFIEPAIYDGMQPTRFDPIPQNGARRHWGVFTVRVPEDFGDRRVVWTLRHRGLTFEIPGHTGSTAYILQATEAPERGASAAVVTFDPSDPGVRGKDGIVFGPLSARVGVPLDLSVWVDPAPRPGNLVWWFKHQGPPGDVIFDPQETKIEGGAGLVEVRTRATFPAPGDYILRVKALENIPDIEFHCCWTNGFLKITVAQ
jgi:hypothetical protein